MTDRARTDCVRIFQAALAAADSRAVILRNLALHPGTLVVGGSELPLSPQARVVVVGAGKASARMAQAAAEILGARLSRGVISVKDGHAIAAGTIDVFEAGHPLPDQRSLANGEAIRQAVQHLMPDDIVLCLFSGGGSALMELLGPGLTLDHLRDATKALMHAGANIVELNCVRKHISLLKGGQLARWAQPARVCALVLSDVVGDDLTTIASGPTSPDPSTFADAAGILERFGVEHQPGASDFFRYIQQQLDSGAADTPKPGDPLFERVQNTIVGANRIALEAAARQAEALGYTTEILTGYMQGEAREVGKLLAAIVRERVERGTHNHCLLVGGETTVSVRGTGRGGRNQESALSAALSLDGMAGVTLLSAATDGGDGSSDAAGALTDSTTLARLAALGIRADAKLAQNDSHTVFAALSDQLITGPTLTNVNDLVVILFA